MVNNKFGIAHKTTFIVLIEHQADLLVHSCNDNNIKSQL